MALEFNCHDLVNIYSSTRTKQDFIEACIKEYLVESERWGIYWSLIDATWDCATDNSEEKQDDQPTQVKSSDDATMKQISALSRYGFVREGIPVKVSFVEHSKGDFINRQAVLDILQKLLLT